MGLPRRDILKLVVLVLGASKLLTIVKVIDGLSLIVVSEVFS
jgi:hypothetical protein